AEQMRTDCTLHHITILSICFNHETAYELGLGIPADPLFRSQETLTFFCVSKNVSVSCAYTQGKREQFSGFNRTLDAINNVFRKRSEERRVGKECIPEWSQYM